MNFDFSKYILEKSNDENFTDNDCCRIAAYFVQNGMCYVKNTKLDIGQRHLHHRKPRYYGGKDTPENLILLNKTVHEMVHARHVFEFQELLDSFPLTPEQLKIVNQLRYEAHRQPIKIAC